MTSIMSFSRGVRMSSLLRGQRGRVLHVLSDDATSAPRLAAFGVTPGAAVTVLQTFPGIIFQCDETEFAIEPDVAQSILVELF